MGSRPFVSVMYLLLAAARLAAQGQVCELPVAARLELADAAGKPVFITPNAVVREGGRTLVAGSHSLEFMSYEAPAVNRLFAAVVDDAGRAGFVAKPDLGPFVLEQVRAVALDRDRWGLLLIATTRPEGDSAEFFERALYFATLRDTQVTSFERIPVPKEIRVRPPLGTLSRLGSAGLVTALAADSTGASGAMVLELGLTGWTSRFVSTRQASYVDLARPDPRATGVIATVRPDYSLSSSHNALFVGALDGALRDQRLVFNAAASPVRSVTILGAQDGVLVAYAVERSRQSSPLTAYVAWFDGRDVQPLGDSIADVIKVWPLLLTPRRRLVGALRDLGGGEAEFLVRDLGATGAVSVNRLGRLVVPTGAAAIDDAGDITIGFGREVSSGRAVQTVLIRFGSGCTPSSRPPPR